MFLKWWLQQLSELLPSGLAQSAPGQGDAVIVEVNREFATLSVRRKGQTMPVAQATPDEDGLKELAAIMAAMDDTPHFVVMRFPPTMLLRKAVVFPSAAKRNLESLLGFEMDRETPFAREEVHWTYRLGRQDHSSLRLDVDLLIVPRAYVDPAIETARLAGFHPKAIEIKDGARETVQIRIGVARTWGRLGSDRPLMALTTTAGVLLLLVIALPFIRQQLALASADRTIRLQTEQAHEAATLRQSLDQTASAAIFIDKERARNGSVVAALAVTTRLVPDDSHLTSLSLRGGRLTIAGLSPSAANLIDLLAQSPAFREPSFDSPVVQNGTNGLETFTISATLTRAPGS